MISKKEEERIAKLERRVSRLECKEKKIKVNSAAIDVLAERIRCQSMEIARQLREGNRITILSDHTMAEAGLDTMLVCEIKKWGE